MRTLIIEDDPSVSGSIALALKARGYTCAVADLGSAGLELARNADHDIILLDLSLPDMDGHKVLRDLRAAHVRTPVLILSGSTDREDKVKGLLTGADDYVTKPFDKDELLARIRAIIRRATGQTPPPKAAVLDGTLLAKSGQAAAWSFSDSYTEPAQGEAGTPAIPDERKPATLVELGGAATPERPQPACPISRKPGQDLGPATIIVVGNGKGGTGKSTIAMHLIAAFLAGDRKVGSIDCDPPQYSLTRYVENRRRFAERNAPAIPLSSHDTLDGETLAGGKADRVLAEQTTRSDIVVIDTPGHDTPLARWAHGRADLLITPINDSFVDLDVLAEMTGDPPRFLRPSSYGAMVAAARAARNAAGQGLQWLVLRNRLAHIDAKNRRRMAHALKELSGTIEFREGPGLRERVIYRELFLSGLTLFDLPCKGATLKLSMSHVTARQELRELMRAVQTLIGAHEERGEHGGGQIPEALRSSRAGQP